MPEEWVLMYYHGVDEPNPFAMRDLGLLLFEPGVQNFRVEQTDEYLIIRGQFAQNEHSFRNNDLEASRQNSQHFEAEDIAQDRVNIDLETAGVLQLYSAETGLDTGQAARLPPEWLVLGAVVHPWATPRLTFVITNILQNVPSSAGSERTFVRLFSRDGHQSIDVDMQDFLRDWGPSSIPPTIIDPPYDQIPFRPSLRLGPFTRPTAPADPPPLHYQPTTVVRLRPMPPGPLPKTIWERLLDPDEFLG